MGFFKKLKKLSLGGLVAQKLVGGEENEGGFLAGIMKGPKKPDPPAPFDPGNRLGSSINGQSGVEQPAMRLGWTNNGRQYANSPFNGANPTYYQQPQAPPAPMSFGGSGMSASGPQTIQPLPSGPGGGTMPPAGAQTPQQGPPTAPNPEMIRAMMVRQGSPPRAIM